MAFQRKTLRDLSPLAREVAEAINECDATKRRLKRLMAHISEIELDAQALRNKFPVEAKTNRECAIRRHTVRGKGRGHTLAELDADFHDPRPLEQRLLGKFDNANR